MTRLDVKARRASIESRNRIARLEGVLSCQRAKGIDTAVTERQLAEAQARCGREIVYARYEHEYAMYLDGQLVGFAPSYIEAERLLDELVYEQLRRAA